MPSENPPLALSYLPACERLAGSAQLASEDKPTRATVLAIDVSHSTRFPSGIDVDRSGTVGVNPHERLEDFGRVPFDDIVCTEPNDSVLGAELAAACDWLSGVNSETSVAVVPFSDFAPSFTSPSVGLLDASLSRRGPQHFQTLEEIVREGPHGGTNWAAAIERGVDLILSSDVPPPACAIVILTDGWPTLPHGRPDRADPSDISAAVIAAQRAERLGIHVHILAIGPKALLQPAQQVAGVTGGQAVLVREIGTLSLVLRKVLEGQ